MRSLLVHNAYRLRQAEIEIYGTSGDESCGAFRMPSPIDGQDLTILASSGEGWDHVSVSRTNRCPNWPEMEFIKKKFFHDDETAMQLHVPASDHVNMHPNCLHLWRPTYIPIPRPPGWMVGAKDPSNKQEIEALRQRMRGEL